MGHQKWKILNALLEHPKRLFLIDSIGAGLTVFMLLVVLLPFEKHIGMPPSTLWFLAVPAFVFALYSACCFWLVRTRWRLFLNLIALANLVYCGFTAGLIMIHYDQLTGPGVTYFTLEIGIICALVWVERRAATRGKFAS